ncbi:hypothetical protein BDV24DRAFT_162277 [Aspergillus arachidicola]|uniref:Uncharacterized protein n=1 Tax=Aspergillus arachidicola TaxID=656916 RepID=A0A2G7G6B8_9EURO|nr:hypothetical protein BDV24DRAFT_162277 [Aspergillus arachidicola]PIG88390.1 hypothetical protein AARAC_004628 [Aspergillus arachidicola]
MEFRETPSFDMMLFAQNILVDGEALYQSPMLELEKEWSGLPGVGAAGSPPVPFQFSDDEANSIEEDACGAIRAMELMRDLKQSVGELWPEKGIVPPGQYDQVKALLDQSKVETIVRLAHSEAERIAWEEAWPYRH